MRNIKVKQIRVTFFFLFVFLLGSGLEHLSNIVLICTVAVYFFTTDYNLISLEKKHRFFLWSFVGFFLLNAVVFLWYQEYKYIERQLSFIVFPVLIALLAKEDLKGKGFLDVATLCFSLGLLFFPTFIIGYYLFTNAPVETGQPIDITSLYQIKRVLFSTNELDYIFHNVYYACYSICAAVFLYLKSKKRRILSTILIVLHIFFIYLSASRMAYLILLALIVLWLFYLKKSLRTKMTFSFVAIVSIYLLLTNYAYLNHKFIKTLPSAFSDRLYIWQNTIEIVGEKWNATGYKAFHQQLAIKNNRLDNPNLNAHNQYFQYFGGLGLLGGLFFLWICFISLSTSFKAKNKMLKLFIIIMMLSFLTESWLYTQKGIVFYMFFLSILWINED